MLTEDTIHATAKTFYTALCDDVVKDSGGDAGDMMAILQIVSTLLQVGARFELEVPKG